MKKPEIIDVTNMAVTPCPSIYHAGFQSCRFESSSKKTIEFAIWYPAKSPETDHHYTHFISGQAALNAAVADGQYPLVVISSGYAGTMYDQCYIAESLARQGYIVLSTSHKSSDKPANNGIERFWHRSFELKQTIDYIYHSEFAPYLTPDISAIGFSAGALTILLLTEVSPRIDKTIQGKSLDATVFGHSNMQTLMEKRLSKLIFLAPGLGSLLPLFNVHQMKHPLMLVLAERDVVVGDTACDYATVGDLVKYILFKNAGHFVFNSEVADIVKEMYPITCQDMGVDRRYVHPYLTEQIIRFLKYC